MTTRHKTAKTKPARRAKRVPTPVATGSVVPAEFRRRYGKSGSCDDETARKLAEVTRGADGKPDATKLRKIAELNGVWRPEYDKLNPGLQRMTCGNRLRKLARDGVHLKWGR